MAPRAGEEEARAGQVLGSYHILRLLTGSKMFPAQVQRHVKSHADAISGFADVLEDDDRQPEALESRMEQMDEKHITNEGPESEGE